MSDLTNIYRLMSRLRRVTDNGDEQADIRQKCSVSYVTCIVDESWIERIEQGMNFVGKAIDEERRFIRVNGEVQPIEKVRKVSKESVQHLARHSDLITHEQQQDIVPDKLYTVERLNDYATYENRFLYRLLVTTRDFIAARYAGIVKATGEYVGKLNAEARLSLPKHTVQFTLTLNDERRDDLGRNAELIERLEKLTRSVRFYLDTPLMTDIAKEAAVNAVITKNNVLKMDRNFKEAVDLYEYLMGYKGDGYEICEKHSDIDITRDINMLSDLTSYALYVRGLGLEEQLERETDASDRLGVEQIRKRSAEEYLLALEERSDRLNAAEARITEMQCGRVVRTVRYAECRAPSPHRQINCRTRTDGAYRRRIYFAPCRYRTSSERGRPCPQGQPRPTRREQSAPQSASGGAQRQFGQLFRRTRNAIRGARETARNRVERSQATTSTSSQLRIEAAIIRQVRE